MRDMLKDSSSSDLYQVSITWKKEEKKKRKEQIVNQGNVRKREYKINKFVELTDLSSTVGMKSYPMPSTSYWVLSVLLISSGSARMEPSGSTPTIYRQHKPLMMYEWLNRPLSRVESYYI